MIDDYSTFLIAWGFLLLIGGWVLINAMIDLGAKRVRGWLTSRSEAQPDSWSIERSGETEP